MIEFYLESRSGVAPYMQLVQQVKQAMRLGLLTAGDRLPTVREVVAKIPINPNTVFKAYRELERESLVQSRPGVGTFIRRTLAPSSLLSHEVLRGDLLNWMQKAHEVGLDKESMMALFADTLKQFQREETTLDEYSTMIKEMG